MKYEKILNPFYLKAGNKGEEISTVARLKEDNNTFEAPQCLPIAIFTTAYSIIRLFEAIRIIEASGKEVYAVDTDSIHTNGVLPSEMLGDKLGQWKMEFIGDKGGMYPVPKVYYAEGKSIKDNQEDKDVTVKKAKGLKGSLTKEDYLKLIEGEVVNKEDPRFVVNRAKSSVSLQDVKININPNSVKRVVLKGGYTKALQVINGYIKKECPNVV